MLRTLIVIAMVIATPAIAQPRDCGPLPATLEGRAYAIDGDTLAMLSGNVRTPDIRLWGIQAPELRDKATNQETMPGMMTRAALADRIFGKALACAPIEWDRHCRVVATCRLPEPTEIITDGLPGDLGAALLFDGGAYVYTTYAAHPDKAARLEAYVLLERFARNRKRGLWQLYAPPRHD